MERESTTGPDRATPNVLSGDQVELRQKLLLGQAKCAELRPLIESAKRLLRATTKDSVAEDKKISQGYRLAPIDGVLERSMETHRARV